MARKQFTAAGMREMVLQDCRDTQDGKNDSDDLDDEQQEMM